MRRKLKPATRAPSRVLHTIHDDAGQLGQDRPTSGCRWSHYNNVIPRWARPGPASLGPHTTPSTAQKDELNSWHDSCVDLGGWGNLIVVSDDGVKFETEVVLGRSYGPTAGCVRIPATSRIRWTLRTRHTLEPLAWHWSHWPRRLVNRGRGGVSCEGV